MATSLVREPLGPFIRATDTVFEEAVEAVAVEAVVVEAVALVEDLIRLSPVAPFTNMPPLIRRRKGP